VSDRVSEQTYFLARLFFKEKSRGFVITLVSSALASSSSLWKNFNLGYNFLSVEANLMKLHMLIHHRKGYILTKDHNSARLFDKIMPLNRYAKMDCMLITEVSRVCVDYRIINSLAYVLIIVKSMAWHVNWLNESQWTLTITRVAIWPRGKTL